MLSRLALVYLALCASACSAKLSARQIKSVFGTLKGLKAVQASAPLSYDLTIIANSTHALVVMQAVDSTLPKADESQVGWMAIGSGMAMKGSDDFILWPNKDKSWTISHRYAKDTVTPADQGPSTNGDFALVPSLCTKPNAKIAQVAFIRKLSPSYSTLSTYKKWDMSSLHLLYSRATRNPGSADPTTTKLMYHDVGYGQLSLSKVSPLTSKVSAYGAGKLIKNLVARSDAAISTSITKRTKAHAASTHARKIATSSTSSSTTPVANALLPTSTSATSSIAAGAGVQQAVNFTSVSAASLARMSTWCALAAPMVAFFVLFR